MTYRLSGIRLLSLALLLAGCSGSKSSDSSASPVPQPSAVASIAATESATPALADTPSPLASEAAAADTGPTPPPTPTPTPTPDPNLLSADNGTILRSYPKGMSADLGDFANHGASMPDAATPPYVVVLELPGQAQISAFSSDMGTVETGQDASMQIAVSTTSATDGFHDVGTIAANTQGGLQTLNTSVAARWVRLSFDAGAKTHYEGITATGTLQPRPAAAPSPDGIYVEAQPFKDDTGAFVPDPGVTTDPWYIRVVTTHEAPPEGLSATRCFDGHAGDAYPGTFDGRSWQQTVAPYHRLMVNDDASLITDGSTYYTRTDRVPKFCVPQDGGGTGSTQELILDGGGNYDEYPYPVADWPKDAAPFHFTKEPGSMLDPADLPKYSTVMFDGMCVASTFLSPPFGKALDDWVAEGHKLIIYDADMCGDKTDYSFLPYPFITSNPGAHGAKGDRLIEVENDDLGTLDATDKAHAFDPAPFAAGPNQIGDANTVTTRDSHWCGHLFGTNVNHVNGFMQMYALYGKGIIIYNGLDHDDDSNPYFERIRLLEQASTAAGNLACTQNAALAFLIEPNRMAKFTPGKAITLPFSMELLANQGWKGRVTLTTSGAFPGTVTPSSLDVAGGTTPLKIAVRIPADAKPGSYAVIVNGDGGNGQSAQSTISFEAAVPIVKQLKLQRRIRLYGIHFDVDSAHIQPRSEPVIKEVAEIMQSNPQWRFRIEGHTDSDGGYDHNMALSQHRAESVIADLVKRYHIARSRMVAQGFGYNRPVASNATAAGKALNRRVELVRL